MPVLFVEPQDPVPYAPNHKVTGNILTLRPTGTTKTMVFNGHLSEPNSGTDLTGVLYARHLADNRMD